MAKKSKKQFNIGDKFLSWEVISCEDPKKYRYLCRCSCGSEKVFNKYNLLRGSYAPCKNCDSAKLSNVAYLRRYWNSELNGVTFTRPQDFSLTQSYWFMCDNKHNIKSTIKDFSVERCLGCKTNIKSSFYREQAYEYALERCLHGSEDDIKEFKEMLVDWFYSGGDWRREEKWESDY